VLLDLAKSLRPDGFSLWVFETNVGAQRFYGRHGQVPVRRTDGSDNEEKAPDIEMAWWGTDPMAAIRARIDDVDGQLARLLAERAALTAAAQRSKAVSGPAGRDPQREAEIVARMAALAPELGEAGIARIMDTVITVSLEAVRQPHPDAG
jgi:chorismate mutase